MSAPVDVLAVMDAAIASRITMNGSTARAEGYNRDTAELREARSAVAELVDAATRAALSCTFAAERNGVAYSELPYADMDALRAALARIGGAA